MLRVTTKTELITAANGQFDNLWKHIDPMSEQQQNATFGSEMATAGKETHWGRDQNIRDVLVHLYEWHQLLLEWVNANSNGTAKPFLPEPYNWKTYPEMNIAFWKKHQNTPLVDAKNMLKTSHKHVMALIDTFSNDELFTKKMFAWTGTSALGAYCVSATSSHYAWAIKKMKIHIILRQVTNNMSNLIKNIIIISVTAVFSALAAQAQTNKKTGGTTYERSM